MKNIPKIAHFYWGANVVPYLRYIALYSFKKFNPDWKIILYVPSVLTESISWEDPWNKTILDVEDYLDRVSDIAHIEKFDMKELGYSNELSEVIKSDIIRLYLLSYVGGLWSDTDIIFFKPISYGIPELEFTSMFCNHGYHSIGFLASAPHNISYQLLFENAKNHLNENKYESVGSTFYNAIVDMTRKDVYNLSMNVVYPQNYVYAESMFLDPADKKISYIKKDTIGWHWYAGHPTCGEFQNKYTESSYKNYNNIVSYLIKEVNNE